MAVVAFAGFRPELLASLKQLGENNNRPWFEAHRQDYESYLLEPARDFVVAMGECLQPLGPDIHAEPKVRGSIFAINRDTRFSQDKTPYKTHLDLWFWQGAGPNRERPGYFFRLTPSSLILGAGIHGFTDQQLERYRRAVLDDGQGARLEQAAKKLPVEIAGKTYKRVPAGLPADHPRAEWLRYSALFAAIEQPVSEVLYTPELPTHCAQTYRSLAPLQQWLVDLLAD